MYEIIVFDTFVHNISNSFFLLWGFIMGDKVMGMQIGIGISLTSFQLS